MPINKGFRSTNVWKAFTLNSTVAAIIILIAFGVKHMFDQWLKYKSGWIGILVASVATFVAAFLTYTLMWVIFGFGGGMLVS